MKTTDMLLCGLVSGALLCWVHGYYPALGFLAAIPLLLGLKQASSRQAFYGGLLCGVLESAILLGTLHYSPVVFTGIALSYGLERALFSVGIVVLGRRQSPMAQALLAPALWVALEFFHCALPATLPNLLGDTQHVGVFLPFAYLGGTFLISFLLIWLNAALVELIWGKLEFMSTAHAVAPLVVWLALVPTAFFGIRVSMGDGETPTKSVSIIQGGHPRWVNKAAESNPQWKLFPLRIYEELALKAPPTDLTLWPEAPMWLRWGEDPELEVSLRNLGEKRAPLLVGLMRKDDGGTYFNSAFAFDGGKVHFKDKQRLVLQQELGFGQGTGPALFDTSGGKIGAVFCLESVVPSYTRRLVQEGVQVIAVLANGADLGRSPVARLHAQRSIVRAVETGRWILHAGHQGFSMVISPQGKTTPPAPLFESTVIAGHFNLRESETPYMLWGDGPLGLGIGFLLVWLLGVQIMAPIKED